MNVLINVELLRDALIKVGKASGTPLSARGTYITNAVADMLTGKTLPDWATVPAQTTKPTKDAQGYSEAFNAFWAAYPSRAGVKSGKAVAYKAWKKLLKDTKLSEEDLLIAVLDALDWQKRTEQWQEEAGKYVPMAATYLNQRRYEDDAPQQTSTEEEGTPMNWDEFQ
jgi:hypothetical protein